MKKNKSKKSKQEDGAGPPNLKIRIEIKSCLPTYMVSGLVNGATTDDDGPPCEGE